MIVLQLRYTDGSTCIYSLPDGTPFPTAKSAEEIGKAVLASLTEEQLKDVHPVSAHALKVRPLKVTT